eukprot:CAMPEP_0168511514 /NCGR_PEP_ID=MMETSP0405-20121227/2180_1 /TAXON_ID=498012 /ORGANISM="Trichosphaerium sp, Strain Am-I-7 wt" /LENGTH=77 /DNA_ID=CAMNT_0008529705 /DNA_START=28 /DNA_END=261 /DNA_ORIENTATION=-
MAKTLTAAQLETIKAGFREGDANKDGKITPEELEAMLKKCGVDEADIKPMAKVAFEAVDTNKDGAITLDEYIAYASK